MNGNNVTVNTGINLNISGLINCNNIITDTLGTNDNGRIYMPGAFTPNHDNLNDIARPITKNILSLTFTVYDEANTIIYTTDQLGQGWEPTINDNTFMKYYYKIRAVTMNNRKIGKWGDLYKLSCFPKDVPIENFYFEDQLTKNGFTGLTAESLSPCQ